MLDELLMLRLNLPADTIHLQSNKFVTDVKIKLMSDSKLNGSPGNQHCLTQKLLNEISDQLVKISDINVVYSFNLKQRWISRLPGTKNILLNDIKRIVNNYGQK